MQIADFAAAARRAVAFSLMARSTTDEAPVLLQYVVTEAADDRAMRALESSIGSLRSE